MTATNKTTNLGLPQFTATDKPTWLGDFNEAMETIDSKAVTTEKMEEYVAANAGGGTPSITKKPTSYTLAWDDTRKAYVCNRVVVPDNNPNKFSVFLFETTFATSTTDTFTFSVDKSGIVTPTTFTVKNDNQFGYMNQLMFVPFGNTSTFYELNFTLTPTSGTNSIKNGSAPLKVAYVDFS